MDPTTQNKPRVSTTIHIPGDAKLVHGADASNFGVAGWIRIGSFGQNEATLFFRDPEQLDRLAVEAERAAKRLRQEIRLRAQLVILPSTD